MPQRRRRPERTCVLKVGWVANHRLVEFWFLGWLEASAEGGWVVVPRHADVYESLYRIQFTLFLHRTRGQRAEARRALPAVKQWYT